ncbi:MAG: radical SAM protein [Spirochaetota bacterium]|nr:radical SAM protein [Spirochaetota bacterium]
MNYVGIVIRPPSEAYSLIIQVSVGCSHSRCTFCSSPKEKMFYIKDIDIIKRDIDEASYYTGYNRAFLAGQDALIVPTGMLLDILRYLKEKNPSIHRVGLYGNTKAILKKSINELKELKDAGLGIIYQGIESGNMNILRKIKKGALPHQQLEAAERVKSAGILLSQTVLLGIGGKKNSIEHAVDTGKHLGRMSPDYASALTLMVIPTTELEIDLRESKFELPDKFELLNELKVIIENMDVTNRCLFTSNHASNYLPIRATLPDDKDEIVNTISLVIGSRDESVLKPEHMRGL